MLKNFGAQSCGTACEGVPAATQASREKSEGSQQGVRGPSWKGLFSRGELPGRTSINHWHEYDLAPRVATVTL